MFLWFKSLQTANINKVQDLNKSLKLFYRNMSITLTENKYLSNQALNLQHWPASWLWDSHRQDTTELLVFYFFPHHPSIKDRFSIGTFQTVEDNRYWCLSNPY